MNRVLFLTSKMASVLFLTSVFALGCGRSGLDGNGGVDDGGGMGCVGPACTPPPDFAGFDLRPPPPPDLARHDGMISPPPDISFGGGDGFPPPIDFGPDGPSCSQMKEICNNNIDDNCNGLIDCKDPACAADPHCVIIGKEICNNGIDDDNNGLIDCADPACKNFPGCQMHLCDPNNPNCADPLCNMIPQCMNLVCKPTVDFGTLQPHDSKSEKMISTVGTKDVALTPCAPGGGGMVVSEFVLAGMDTTAVKLDFTQSANSDHVFALFRAGINQACTANPIECYDPKSAASGSHNFVLAPGHYYLFVQSFTVQHQGTVDAILSTPSNAHPEICNNGVDDDMNGLIDCADPACFNDANCKGKECKPDFNVGTVLLNDPGKKLSFTTVGAPNAYSVNCGGSGQSIAVEFSLAQTAGIGLDFTERAFGDHTIGLYKMPAAGLGCDALQTDCFLPTINPNNGTNGDSVAWGDYPAGKYLFIFKALKPGKEGPIDITIYAYQNKKVELCHNGIDDDNNGLIDCADMACFSDPGCGPPVCMPSVDFGTMNLGDSHSTVLDLKGGIPKLTATCAKGGGLSRVIQLKLAQNAGLGINCNQMGGQAVVDLMYEAGPRDSCDKNELSCADPSTLPFKCNFEWPNLQAGTYYLMVTAFQAGAEGTVAVTLTSIMDRALEICNNGIDDDMDGFIDCADKKCALSPYCVPRACMADQTVDPMPLDGSMVVRQLNTLNKQVTAQPPCEVKPGGGDAVVYINMPAKATLNVDFLQGFGKTNHVLALYPDLGKGLICEAAKSIACFPTMGSGMGRITFANVPAGPYWLVAAADQPGDEGPIFLDFTAKP